MQQSDAYILDTMFDAGKIVYNRGKAKEVEFKQHEATMNIDRMQAWINVCVGLVNHAQKTSQEQIWAELRKNPYLNDVGNTGGADWEIRVREMLIELGLLKRQNFTR